jgi:hypothetical protein
VHTFLYISMSIGWEEAKDIIADDNQGVMK